MGVESILQVLVSRNPPIVLARQQGQFWEADRGNGYHY